MIININTELQYLAQDHADDQADMQYDEMMEAMYGTDPRWEGTDWNDGLMYWERK